MLDAEACVAATAARRVVGGVSCMPGPVGSRCFFDRSACLAAAKALEKRDEGFGTLTCLSFAAYPG
jgi:hypothetical protein